MRTLCWSCLAITLHLALFASAQVDVGYPDTNASAGIPVSAPFTSLIFSALGGSQVILRLDAARLSAAGLTAGATLRDVSFSSIGTGTITTTSFLALVGHVAPPWSTSVFLPNLSTTVTLFDSATQGTFNWSVVANAWTPLNSSAIGLVWDGVNDIGVYLATGNITTNGAANWYGYFHSGDGTIQRNVALNSPPNQPPTSDLHGLRTRLTFLPLPPLAPGTVSFLPSNFVTPGSGLTVVFSAPNNSSETYIPFVSCTPGALVVPGTPFSLPLAFDACSSFYFNHVLSPLVFALTPPGQFFGTLTTTGVATGVVTIPPSLVPPGLNLSLSIAFVTAAGPTITGAHGPGTFTIL